MKLVVASRKSDLARIQSYSVAEALQRKFPELQIEFHFHESLGDKNLTDPLWKMPDKGVFTADLTEGLIAGHWDIVVHSWKDLPVETHPQTAVIATLEREDQRDLLLIPTSRLTALQQEGQKKLHVLSSSPRREFNLTPFLKAHWPHGLDEVKFSSVRGNVPTRIRKLLSGEGDALIVAKAALDRLLAATRTEFQSMQAEVRAALAQCQWMILPLSQNPTAAAQGALAVEALRTRIDLKKLFEGIHDQVAFRNVEEERALLKARGGGCHQKVGISTIQHPSGRILRVLGEQVDQRSFEPHAGRGAQIQKAKGQSAKALAASAISWFSREALPVNLPSQRNFYVSHPEAMPESWSPKELAPALIWTAGLPTWRKLAGRGFWVNGSDDSFGEQQPHVDHLVAQPQPWVKLSHNDASSKEMTLLPTYRLRASSVDSSRLEGYSIFYWKSGSQFARALELRPEIRDGTHCCGLGKTAEEIRRILPSAEVEVFLDEQDWRQYFEIK